MERQYTWEAVDDGYTRMTLRNRRTPSGFSKMAAPFMAKAMRRANQKDLALLKRLLEDQALLSIDRGTEKLVRLGPVAGVSEVPKPNRTPETVTTRFSRETTAGSLSER